MAYARMSTAALAIALAIGSVASAQQDAAGELVDRLDLERYKAAIRGLAQFGDRRQGTQRNRDAIDWLEAELERYGCTNTERITYIHPSPEASAPRSVADEAPSADHAARSEGEEGANLVALPEARPAPRRSREGGATQFGFRGPTGVNTDPLAQRDEKLRELNAEPAPRGPSERQEVYCTKIGTTHPDEMYIVGAHMDGHGWGEAANDDGSGTALVLELARVLSAPDVQTERSIRFILWNNEETGLNGAWAYVNQRRGLQGRESPAGSGRYPEPRWLGMVTHDMMLWDHGMPRPDGTVGPQQRPEADVNIEFQSSSRQASASMQLAFVFKAASDRYNTDYPATVGPHMTNTDSVPFMDHVASISLRENERGMQTGAGWNPHWHQPSDLYATYSDEDFKLGLNAAQTTLAALAQLAGASFRRP